MSSSFNEKSVEKFGFAVNEIVELQNINSLAIRMHHVKSGAKLLYIKNDDTENLFSVAFRTPPEDDTGLPHIMEHTVLAGSKRYPLKDPFVELLKSSVATFLNAMTYPDKTIYPCASMNEQDFHNIMRVYADAVFFPKISKEKFNQEGYHYEFKKGDDPDSDLTVKGVVYNEMKGVYSDLSGIISREETKSIFPDTPYGKDSGGDPKYIKSLKYSDFKAFHKKYYHPSNSYIIIYGSFPLENSLKILDNEFLCKFNKQDINIDIPRQQSWTSPVEKNVKYPVANGSTKRKTAITVNFKTNLLTDTVETLAMSLIESYLLGNSSSPLKRAIVDSKMADSLTSSGYGDYQKETYFTIGIKGTDADKKKAFLDLIFKVCKNEAKHGFDKKGIDAAFHKVEFSLKEITSSYPIHLMDKIYNYWLYDSDPLALLRENAGIDRLKECILQDKFYLEKILEKNIINNQSYSVITFVPDQNYNKKSEKSFKAEMSSIKQQLSERKIKKILDETIKFDKAQQKKESKKALSSLPILNISDLPKVPLEPKVDFLQVESIPLLVNDTFTNDINYLTIAINLSGIPEDLLDYLPLYKTIMLKSGAGDKSYIEMAEEENLYTGGIVSSISTDGKVGLPDSQVSTMFIASKSISRNTLKLLDIIENRLLNPDLNDKNRIQDIVIQQKSSLIAGIISSGSSYAQYYSSRGLNKNYFLNEKFNGLTSIRFIKSISDDFDNSFDKLRRNLQRIKKFILNKNRITLSVAGGCHFKELITKWLTKLAIKLDKTGIDTKAIECNFTSGEEVGICQASEVSFNALSFIADEFEVHNPAYFFIAQFMTYNLLWNKIRMENGAYGTNAGFSRLSGIFSLTSFRDPCITETFKTYINSFILARNDLKTLKDNFDRSIIGSFKKLDKPIRPGSIVNLSLSRYLKGINTEYRISFRRKLLELNSKEILTALDLLDQSSKIHNKCSISNKSLLMKANKSKDSALNFKLVEI